MMSADVRVSTLPWSWYPEEEEVRFKCGPTATLPVAYDVANPADGEFIVRAVNSHARLVAALEAITTHTGCSDPDCCKAAIEQEDARQLCRAALSAAKEKA